MILIMVNHTCSAVEEEIWEYISEGMTSTIGVDYLPFVIRTTISDTWMSIIISSNI